jgi:hypothetical protein
VACHTISPSVNSGDSGNKILIRQERTIKTVLAVYADGIVYTTQRRAQEQNGLIGASVCCGIITIV